MRWVVILLSKIVSKLENETKIVSRYSLGFRAFMILFWGGLAFYTAIELPTVWFDESYSKMGLTIVVGLFLLLLIVGIFFSILARITLTDDFIEVKHLTSKKISFDQLKQIELGSNFIELHSGKGKKIVVNWLYEDYDKIRHFIIEKTQSLSGISLTQREKYRKPW